MRTVRTPLWLGIVALVILAANRSNADELYVLGVAGHGARAGCTETFWSSDTLFYNLANTNLAVTLLGLSNGARRSDAPNTIAIPAGRTVSISQAAWQPANTPPLWVYHLDVPPSLAVDAALYPSVDNPFCAVPYFLAHSYGKTKLPIFHALAPAGQRQIVTGLSLGEIPGHINVGIYNGGQDFASAVIEIHRACDGALVDTRTVIVPGNTIEQFGSLLATTSQTDCFEPNGFNGYATVTVSQPSLVYAAMVADGQTPISAIQVQ